MPDDWTELLDRHGPALLLYARQLAAGRADAEDAVQEGFVRFWSGRARAADAAGYLFACVRSAALDARRSSGRRLRREQAAARPEGLFDAPPEDAAFAPAVERALAGLAAEQREVLTLRIWGGLTFPQIAEAVGIPVNTASSRFRYALSALRERLSPEDLP